MRLIALIGLPAILLLAGVSAFPYLTPITYEAAAARVSEALTATSSLPTVPTVKHLPPPEPLKAIYMSQCVSGTPSMRNSLVKLVEDTELNAIIIDIRDFTGKISFPTDNPLLKDSVSTACGAKDMKDFIAKLHDKGIFVIGRITTFQNPYYTKMYPEQAVQRKSGGIWKDHKGLAFVDVGARPYWDQVVELGRISYELGFDELNFDYVRFPSDGPMAEAVYTWSKGKSKAAALEEFFKYLTEALRTTGAILSADLFGMTATNVDDLNIGQVLERALPYFDYIYPMVYPSHYPSGFNGYKNVNANAYNIVKFSMKRSADRAVATTTIVAALTHTLIASTSPQLYTKASYDKRKMRPWLQSFNYPVPYTPEMVREQIKATYDAGLTSWIFWDAANKYASLRQVLGK